MEQNFRFAEALGDFAVVMDDGRIVHRGSMARARARHGDADAAARAVAGGASVNAPAKAGSTRRASCDGERGRANAGVTLERHGRRRQLPYDDDATEPIPVVRADYLPILLVPALALVASR